MTPAERLRAMGLDLPPAPAPKGSYAAAVIDGNRIHVSGQIVLDGPSVASPGRVGREVPPEAAKALVRRATLQGLAAAASVAGSLDAIRRAVRVAVYVSAAEGFDRAHEVANGATELLNAVFGEEHRPARIALGVGTLPLGAPVEVELLLERA